MANEATVANLDDDIHYFTITDTTAIVKGSIMVMKDPREVSRHATADDKPAGISVEEKKSGDGQTKVGVRVRGIMEMTADGNITVGNLLRLSATANRVRAASTSLSGTDLENIFGRALETATDGEVFNVYMNTMR